MTSFEFSKAAKCSTKITAMSFATFYCSRARATSNKLVVPAMYILRSPCFSWILDCSSSLYSWLWRGSSMKRRRLRKAKRSIVWTKNGSFTRRCSLSTTSGNTFARQNNSSNCLRLTPKARTHRQQWTEVYTWRARLIAWVSTLSPWIYSRRNSFNSSIDVSRLFSYKLVK